MGVTFDTKPELVTAVSDLRRTPLGRLAREGGNSEGLRRALPGLTAERIAPAMFQSSI